MDPDIRNFVLAAAVCLGVAALFVSMARKHVGAHKGSFAVLGTLTVAAFVTDTVLRARSRAHVISPWNGGTLAVALTVGAVFVLALFGRRQFAKLSGAIVAKIRLAVEEHRDPRLRLRNRCVRKYQTVVERLGFVFETRSNSLRRARLSAVLILRDFSDEEIGIIADYLNMSLFAGRADKRQLVRFLEDERDTAANRPLDVSGHFVRLNRLADRAAMPFVDSATSAS